MKSQKRKLAMHENRVKNKRAKAAAKRHTHETSKHSHTSKSTHTARSRGIPEALPVFNLPPWLQLLDRRQKPQEPQGNVIPFPVSHFSRKSKLVAQEQAS